MAEAFAHLQFAHLCCNFSASSTLAASQHAASMQPACSQHAASMQHDCSMPHDRGKRKSKHTLENQSTLSRILHSNNSTTYSRERGNQSTLSMMVLVVMVYIIIHSHSRALSLLCHNDEEDDDVGQWH